MAPGRPPLVILSVPTFVPVNGMDLSLPSTSSCGATAISCKAPAAPSPAALTECVQLRPLFCTLSPETERGGELPEEVAGGDMGLPEEETALWPVQEEGGTPVTPVQQPAGRITPDTTPRPHAQGRPVGV
ncbi:hypothetical protein MTO96_029307 [Rhipicephalus appendiculatus]